MIGAGIHVSGHYNTPYTVTFAGAALAKTLPFVNSNPGRMMLRFCFIGLLLSLSSSTDQCSDYPEAHQEHHHQAQLKSL